MRNGREIPGIRIDSNDRHNQQRRFPVVSIGGRKSPRFVAMSTKRSGERRLRALIGFKTFSHLIERVASLGYQAAQTQTPFERLLLTPTKQDRHLHPCI